MSIDKIIDALAQVNAKANDLKSEKADLENQLAELVSKDVQAQLKDKDYGCGTANIETDKYKLKAVIAKNVKWDEKQLENIADLIKQAGKNPKEYIKYKLSVLETGYKNWPSDIQKVFEPARSVEPSKPKFTYEVK